MNNYTQLSPTYFTESFWHKVGRYMLAMGVMGLGLGMIV